MADCVFCKIVAGELPSKKVWEDEEILAFYDIHPSAPVHIVVIPRKHFVSNLGEATEEHQQILGKLQLAAGKIAEKAGISKSFSYRTNTGAEAGQTVWHLHYHLQGGWKER